MIAHYFKGIPLSIWYSSRKIPNQTILSIHNHLSNVLHSFATKYSPINTRLKMSSRTKKKYENRKKNKKAKQELDVSEKSSENEQVFSRNTGDVEIKSEVMSTSSNKDRKNDEKEFKEKELQELSLMETSSESFQVPSTSTDDVETKSEVMSTSPHWEVEDRRTDKHFDQKSFTKTKDNKDNKQEWENKEEKYQRGETKFQTRKDEYNSRSDYNQGYNKHGNRSSYGNFTHPKRDGDQDKKFGNNSKDGKRYYDDKYYRDDSKKGDYHRRNNSRDRFDQGSNESQRSNRQEQNPSYVRRSNDASRDREFDTWNSIKINKEEETENVIETFGDLFCADDEYALGHCVAEDMNMGSGIATEFRSKFKRVDELLQQRIRQGDVATIFVDKRYIYYLVTKRYSNGKPTYETLFRALRKMREHAINNGVKKIALPRIGCGLDGLEWRQVKSMLQFIFKDVDVEIKVFNFQQESGSMMSAPKRKCPVKNVLKSVVNIENYTIIIYPCSKSEYVTKTMIDLDKKFNIRSDYLKSRRNLGEIIRTDASRLNYIIYGVVVKENSRDPINYVYFQRCIKEIDQRNNKNEQYEFVAMEAFRDDPDNMVIHKLVNLMRNTFYYGVSVYICWPEELKQFAPRETEY